MPDISLKEQTYEAILNRCLARVDDALDKREGSVLYDALAPCAAELAMLYATLWAQMDRAFPDTAGDVDLTNKAKERSVFRLPATHAVRRGVFTGPGGAPKDIPLGSRFSGGSVNFAATARMGSGAYQLTAEAEGEAGNLYRGTLLPIDYIEDLSSAELTDVLIYGEEEESDDALRARYLLTLRETRFGGNAADYKERVEAVPGVGVCKVYPAWQGGGTVRLVVTSAAGGVPTQALVDEVQNAVDPPGYTGKGKGFAPIGHNVTVAGAKGRQVNVAFALTFDAGYTWESLRGEVTVAIDSYVAECVAEWESMERLTMRLARVESAVLGVRGVLDIAGTTLNGSAANLELQTEEIPVLGEVANR